MELLIVQLLIVAFLLAYLMGEDAGTVNTTIVPAEVAYVPVPDEVWEAWEEKMDQYWAEVRYKTQSFYGRRDIADGLNWSAEVGPTPA